MRYNLFCSEVSLWVSQHLIADHELLYSGRPTIDSGVVLRNDNCNCTSREVGSRVHGTANENNPHSDDPGQLVPHGSPEKYNSELEL